MSDKTDMEGNLEGQFLIAMPGIGDPRFERALILICVHSDQGAMGLVVNETAEDMTLSGLMKKLDVEINANGDTPIRLGGPVERGRGFVLHSHEYEKVGSLDIKGAFRLSGTVETLRAIGRNEGPAQHLITLGYTGWGPGQLEEEIRSNGWLACPAEPDIVFAQSDQSKWRDALAMLGISPELLSAEGGSA